MEFPPIRDGKRFVCKTTDLIKSIILQGKGVQTKCASQQKDLVAEVWGDLAEIIVCIYTLKYFSHLFHIKY